MLNDMTEVTPAPSETERQQRVVLRITPWAYVP
jgi:hypothetical protein